jgi:hypothetical protein
MSRPAYNSMAESASIQATASRRSSCVPNASRLTARCVAMSSARCATPIHRMA